MQVTNNPLIKTNRYTQFSAISFKQIPQIKSLMPENIGKCAEGLIGKVRLRNADNTECYMNVYKKIIHEVNENYSIQNESGDIIGEIILAVKKYTNYDKLNVPKDPSHVYVSTLINYSNPDTPCNNKKLEYYKDIGIRLMQIALKRSEEALCNGKIKLIAKHESKPWYKDIIGMIEEFPSSLDYGFDFNIHNPNSMILPAYSRESLAELHGGL